MDVLNSCSDFNMSYIDAQRRETVKRHKLRTFFYSEKRKNTFVFSAHFNIPCGNLLLIQTGFNVVTIFNLAFSWAFITKMIYILQYFMKGERTKIMTQIESTAKMSCVAFYTQNVYNIYDSNRLFYSLLLECITFIIPNSRSPFFCCFFLFLI